MYLAKITMNRAKARDRWRQYAKSVRECAAHTTDDLLKGCYRELARGHPILDLRETMCIAGVDEHGRPRLAIAPANAARVYYSAGGDTWTQERGHVFGADDVYTTSSRKNVVLPMDVLPSRWPRYTRLSSQVPLIPPLYRPTERDLPKYHILFEAEWEQKPPRDPALLHRLNYSLMFAVIATWQLTELEARVLGQLATSPK